MKNTVIIVGGGMGLRMNNTLPKQFMEINHRPLLFYTIERFYHFDQNISIILVLPETYHIYWNKWCKKYSFQIPHHLVAGGEARYHSVKNGLSMTERKSLIAIHDAVRPFITTDFLQKAFETAAKNGSAVPVLNVNETVRQISDTSSTILPRKEIYTVQTPQIFKAEWIYKGYEQPYTKDITDDAILVEKAGYNLTFMEGLRYNIKITFPEDMLLAEAWLKNDIH